jgi:hypothetical protein
MKRIVFITFCFLVVITFLAITDSAEGLICEEVYQVIEDACPTEPTHPNYPEGGWTNHGDYVSCVVMALQPLKDSGEVTQECRQAIVTEAAESEVGKTYVQCPCESYSRIDDHIQVLEPVVCADRRDSSPDRSSVTLQDDYIVCIYNDEFYDIYESSYATIEELQVCQDMILQSEMWSLNGCPNAP